jgi:hypothetical protein
MVRADLQDFERLLAVEERVRFRLGNLIREHLCTFLTNLCAVFNQITVVLSLLVHILPCTSGRPPWIGASVLEQSL